MDFQVQVLQELEEIDYSDSAFDGSMILNLDLSDVWWYVPVLVLISSA